MTERPIILSGAEVRAVLGGRKTQLRRVITMQNSDGWGPRSIPPWSSLDFSGATIDTTGSRCGCGDYLKVPYGGAEEWWVETRHRVHSLVQPKDILWVRESFCIEHSIDGNKPPHDGRPVKTSQCPEWGQEWEQPHYRATDPAPELMLPSGECGCRWRPSIHMPRWASRITLEVTSVRPERVQNISEDDALAEGISEVPFRPDDGFPVCSGYMAGPDDGVSPLDPTARDTFARLWETINGKRTGCSWADNPWVWAITFRRCA